MDKNTGRLASFQNFFLGIFRFFFGGKIRLIISILLIIAIGFFAYRSFSTKQAAPTYQTEAATKGSLITTLSASGTITGVNSVNITTGASGVINQVYVKKGDVVKQGQKIAEITLDQGSQQKQAAAYASYLSAKNQLDSANAKYNSLQAAAFKANQALINDGIARDLKTDDPSYIQQNDTWLQAEADYKNQATVVAGAQSSLTSSWLSYQQISSTITSPSDGTIANLTLTPGLSVTQTTSTSNTTSTTQTVGSISREKGQVQSTVNLTEIDVVKVQVDQKATLTLDAFPDKTFSAKISAIDTTGAVSSGVTTYPATITLDTALDTIYPNMAVSAKIITDIKDNVVLVPLAAVATANGQSTVRVLKDGKVNEVAVQVGSSNDTQTEITSGLNEGDMVVTGSTGGITSQTQTTGTSPFSAFGNRGSGGGGGATVRITR